MPKVQPAEQQRPAPRLYLATPPVAEPTDFAAKLGDALTGGDVAAVLLRLAPTDERTLINRVKALAPAVQSAGAALVLDGHAEVAARAGADGAHLTGIDAFTEAVGSLKPARIAGCGGLKTRHDAMLAAERGADYVMFGEPDAAGLRPSFEAIVERLEWWAQVFEVPCVGYVASLDEIELLSAAGADFVVVGDCIWDAPGGAKGALAAASRRLAQIAAMG
jgi:thiamine-phosphate pyrophosphorylase